jgi:hypothetical protein
MNYASARIFGIIALIMLNACNHYKVETGFNEFRNTRTCSLSNNRIQFDSGFFSGSRATNLDLEKLEDGNLAAFITIHNVSGKHTSFRPDSNFIFKIFSQNKSPEQIKLVSFMPTDNKEWTDSTYTQYGNIYTRNSQSTASVIMSEEQLMKIAGADKIEFAFETFQGPIKGTLGNNELQPFREFINKCYI